MAHLRCAARRWPLLLVLIAPLLAQAQSDNGDYSEAYYRLDSLNRGLPELRPPVNLQTPQAALENFILSAREGDFERAARSLNLNLISQQRRAARAAALAERLFYVINQRLWIDWEDIPDRPDGQLDLGRSGDPLVGVPRRSLRIGSIDVDGRDAAIRLQRVKVNDADPVWVFAASTVDNIDRLYDQYGPGWLEQNLPAWAKARGLANLPLWQWLALLVVAWLSVACGWLGNRLIRRFLGGMEADWVPQAIEALRLPASVLAGLLVFYLANLTLLALTGPIAKILNPTLLVLLVAALTWVGMRLIRLVSEYFTQRYADDLQNYERPEVRRTLTYIAIARRVLIFIALLVGISVALSQLNLLKALGISLLASAGIASVIAGIAAQNVLGNIMAGIRIAITRPAVIGDNVYFEGEWGYVEEITYTYLVIRTWDERRVVVPLKYFLSQPFENWSMKDPKLTKPFYLYADYRIDVDDVRQKFAELLRADDDWDEATEPTVQVTGLTDEAVEIRALCSASNPSVAWDLHCRMREALMRYVQGLDDGRYLPRRRLALQEGQEAAKKPRKRSTKSRKSAAT